MARTLLEDAINGHKLIIKELDEYIKEGGSEHRLSSSATETGTETSFPNEAVGVDLQVEKKKEVKLNAKDYHVRIDLSGILPEKTKKPVIDLNPETEEHEMKQCQVLFDILDVGVDADVIEDIVKHPVITTLILKKWEKTRKFYYFTTFMYFLFLLSYSMLIYDLFGPKYKGLSDNGTYYNNRCPESSEKYKEELANLTACQYRDPICNIGKFVHIVI